MTNREWLESLSDEELTEALHEHFRDTNSPCMMCVYEFGQGCDLNCKDGFLKWLKRKCDYEE